MLTWLKSPKIKKIINIGKIILIILPFIYIYSQIQGKNFHSVISSTAWWTIPFTIVSSFIILLLQGTRWWILLRAFYPSLSYIKSIKCHFIAGFYSLILPTSAGQDVVRAVLISKEIDYGISWGGAWINRLLGLIVWLAMSFYGIFKINRALLPSSFFPIFIAASILLAGLIYFSFSKKMTRPIRILTARFIPEKINLMLQKVREGVYRYRGKMHYLVLSALLTIVTQFMLVAGTALLLYGITGVNTLWACFAFLPIIEIICISVPLTPNATGIRELLFSMMFKIINLSQEALGVYILLSFLVILIRLLGGIPVFLAFASKIPLPFKPKP